MCGRERKRAIKRGESQINNIGITVQNQKGTAQGKNCILEEDGRAGKGTHAPKEPIEGKKDDREEGTLQREPNEGEAAILMDGLRKGGKWERRGGEGRGEGRGGRWGEIPNDQNNCHY